MSYADLRADCEDLSPGIRCIGIPSDDTASHLAVLHAFGGYAFAYGDGGFDTTDIGLAGEGALAAAAFLDAEAAAGRLDPALTTAAAAEEFADGDLAFFFSTPLGDPGIDDWDAQALRPDGAGGRAAVLADAYGLAVSAATDRPEAAEWFVLEFMTDRQVAFELFLAGGRPPALAQAYTDAVATDPRIAAFNPASADPAVLYPALPETRTLLGAFANAVGIVYHQAYDEAVPDAATAFTQAATAVRSMLDGG
jgi:arabinogalactan oligomer/maltooligosaccharide transport system substrate-binding protein